MKMKVRRGDSILVVVDVQDKLIDTIAEHEIVIENIKALIKSAVALQVPILATEQEKLGETVPELKSLLSEPSTRKLSFSSCDSQEFMTKLKSTGKRTLIICGLETHICVMQTALDLLAGHHRIIVARDATSSYSTLDRDTAIQRMETAGAEISTAEAVIYELTEKAGTDEFRKILDIVKERRAEVAKRTPKNPKSPRTH